LIQQSAYGNTHTETQSSYTSHRDKHCALVDAKTNDTESSATAASRGSEPSIALLYLPRCNKISTYVRSLRSRTRLLAPSFWPRTIYLLFCFRNLYFLLRLRTISFISMCCCAILRYLMSRLHSATS